MEAQKYTPEEEVHQIPCRVWLPLEQRAILVDLMHLPNEAMTIDVIAHSLATKNRYNGATPYPYSVAVHSILVSQLIAKDAPRQLMFEAMLHDAGETFVGDVIHPIKRKLPDFKVIENIVEAQLRTLYALPAVESPEVKLADTKALWLEQHLLQNKLFSDEALATLTNRDMVFAEWACQREFTWTAAREMFHIHYGLLLEDTAN